MNEDRINTFINEYAERWNHNVDVTSARQRVNMRTQDLTRARAIYSNSLRAYRTLKLSREKRNPIVDFNIRTHEINVNETTAQESLLAERLRESELVTNSNSRSTNLNGVQQMRNIQDNAFVNRIEYNGEGSYSDSIIIFTKKILATYTDTENQQQQADMGKYKIIFKANCLLPKIVNLTYPDYRFQHPCIRHNTMCMGGYKEPIKTNAIAKRFDLVVYTIIHFLQNVESVRPYININIFLRNRSESTEDFVNSETTNADSLT